MTDPRIPIDPRLRNLGLLVGVLMMLAGLVLGWIKSGQPVALPPTGWKRP